jgi:hypothetical protein
MVFFVRVLLWTLVRLSILVSLLRVVNTEPQGIIAWPIAKILEFILGPHHGIIYRRAGMCLCLLFLLCSNDTCRTERANCVAFVSR